MDSIYNPIIDMLVGIGMAMLITTIRNGPIHLQTGTEEPDLTNIHFIGLIYIVVGYDLMHDTPMFY
jgi:hypothetical protein